LLVLLAAIALLTVTAVSLVLGNRSAVNLSGIETRYVPLIELDRDLKTTNAQLTRTLVDAAAAGEEGKVHDADALRDELLRGLRTGARTIVDNGGDPSALSVELALYYGPARDLTLAIARGAPAGQLTSKIDAMQRAQLEFTSHLDAATAPNHERLAAAFDAARQSQRASLRIDIAVAIGALLVMTLLSWWIIRTTVRSVHAVTAGVERLAAGLRVGAQVLHLQMHEQPGLHIEPWRLPRNAVGRHAHQSKMNRCPVQQHQRQQDAEHDLARAHRMGMRRRGGRLFWRRFRQDFAHGTQRSPHGTRSADEWGFFASRPCQQVRAARASVRKRGA
jgi:hypothetical protein